MKRITLFFASLLFAVTALAQTTYTNTRQLRFYAVTTASDTVPVGNTKDGRMWYDFSTDNFRAIVNGVVITIGSGGGGGGNLSGTLTAPRIPFASGANTLVDDSNLTWDNTNKRIALGTSYLRSRSTNDLYWGSTTGNSTSTGTNNVNIGNDLATGWTDTEYSVNIGYQAGKNTVSGQYDVNIGYRAGMNANDHFNVFIGYDAGVNCSGGSENVGIGYRAIYNAQGEDNVGIGFSPGSSLASGGSSVRNNTFIGYFAGAPNDAGAPGIDYVDGNGSIFIGQYVTAMATNESGQINIGIAFFSRYNSAANPPPLIETGNIGLYVSTPTARVHLPAGASAANSSPLKFTSGTNLTAPEAGAVEYNGTDLFFTPVATRQTFTFNDATQTLTNKTLSTATTFSASPTINDGIKFTFNPDATNPGLNSGAQAGNPSSLTNGDIWYNSSINALMSRVNTSTSALLNCAPSDNVSARIPFFAENNTGRMTSVAGFTATSTVVTVPRLVSTTSATLSPFNMAGSTSDPSAPVDGDMNYRTDTDVFRVRANGAWQTLSYLTNGAGSNVFALSNGTNLVGSGLSSLSGALSGISFAGTNTTAQTIISNFSGTITTSGSSTQAIVDGSLFSNTTALEVEFCLTGIKTDGTESFSAKRSAICRKDSGGTWTVDVQGTAEIKESDAGAVTSIDIVINSSTPSATVVMGGASGTYTIRGSTRVISATN